MCDPPASVVFMTEEQVAQVAAKLMLSVVFVAIPVAILIAGEPPKHGSWWYPNPSRWDYRFKLWWYAVLDANAPRRPSARRLVRVIVVLIVVGTLAGIWLPSPHK